MTAQSCTPFVSHDNFKPFDNSMMEIRSKKLNLCGFVRAVMRFIVLVIYVETNLS